MTEKKNAERNHYQTFNIDVKLYFKGHSIKENYKKLSISLTSVHHWMDRIKNV